MPEGQSLVPIVISVGASILLLTLALFGGIFATVNALFNRLNRHHATKMNLNDGLDNLRKHIDQSHGELSTLVKSHGENLSSVIHLLGSLQKTVHDLQRQAYQQTVVGDNEIKE